MLNAQCMKAVVQMHHKAKNVILIGAVKLLVDQNSVVTTILLNNMWVMVVIGIDILVKARLVEVLHHLEEVVVVGELINTQPVAMDRN